MERKRLLSELVFAYRKRAARSGVDFFVEGPKDKLLMDKFLAEQAPAHFAVYAMDSIDFTGKNIAELGLPAPSARSEVIALRQELIDAEVDLSGTFFLVDRDQEDIVPSPLIDGVHVTDSGALPVHLFDNLVEALLCAMLLEGRISADILKRSVFKICRAIYIVRSAAKLLGVSAKITSPKEFIVKLPDGSCELNLDGYMTRCLYAGGAISSLESMRLCVVEVAERVDELGLPGFTFVNDHDLWAVLRDLFKVFGDKSNKSAEDIEGAVLMTFSSRKLSSHDLFKRVSEMFAQRFVSSEMEVAQG